MPRNQFLIAKRNALLAVGTIGLFIDPLFVYTLSISDAFLCMFVAGGFAVALTTICCILNAVHLYEIWSQFSKWNLTLLFELFSALPLFQLLLWVVTRSFLEQGSMTEVTNAFLFLFLLQYLPRVVYHIYKLGQVKSGYFLRSIWWGFSVNMLAYFVAAHAAGACWYLMGIQRTATCLQLQCMDIVCGLRTLTCQPSFSYTLTATLDRGRIQWAENPNARLFCIASDNNYYDYGVFKLAVQLVTHHNQVEKILLSLFWGLKTLSSFGSVTYTIIWQEIVFNISLLTVSLILVTMLIGNMKAFLSATTSKKQEMHIRMRDLDLWMKRRRFPAEIKQRVRDCEWKRWALLQGVDPFEIVRSLPEGLWRDIKQHLCLDLVRQVPLFQHMDELVLGNLCDHLKSHVYPKGEMITREGEPVQRMLFFVRGHLQCNQLLREDIVSRCMLGPGNFIGDELLSWCLRRPFIKRLLHSSFSVVTTEDIEAFGLDADDLKYVSGQYRSSFVSKKAMRSARYYSPGWRTWATVSIQLAWKRYKGRS